MISAVVGVLVRLAFKQNPHLVWLSAPLGMSLALAAMQVTRTVHPPGTALQTAGREAHRVSQSLGTPLKLLALSGGWLSLEAVAYGLNVRLPHMLCLAPYQMVRCGMDW